LYYAKKEQENAMETKQPTYFTDYRSLKMTRDAQGVLVVEYRHIVVHVRVCHAERLEDVRVGEFAQRMPPTQAGPFNGCNLGFEK
jgi:hypothetical protein